MEDAGTIDFTLPAGMLRTYGTVRPDKKGKCFYLDLWLKGKNHRLYRLPVRGEMVGCKTEDMAKGLQLYVSMQIHQGIFRPERFKIKRALHLRAYSEVWIEKQTHLGAATKHSYRTCLNKYIIPALGDHFISDITEGDLETFVKSLRLAPKTKGNVLGCLMKVLHDAERNRDIDRAPRKPILRGSDTVVDPEVIWLEPTEQKKIIDALSPKYRPIFLFGMLTGCRPSEARALQWDDVKLSRGEIIFRHTLDVEEKLVPVKGKKVLPVPMSDELKELLSGIPVSLNGFVFNNPRTGRPFTRNIHKIFARASKKALGYSVGIAKATRTSFAQQLANDGVEINMVGRLLRHSPSSGTRITKRYYEFKTSSMKSAVDKVRKIR